MSVSPNHVTERPRGPGPRKEKSRQEKRQGGMCTAAFRHSEGFQSEETGKAVNSCWKLSNTQFFLFLKRSLLVSCDLYRHRFLNSHLPNEVYSEVPKYGGLLLFPVCSMARAFTGWVRVAALQCEACTLCVVYQKSPEQRLALGKCP